MTLCSGGVQIESQSAHWKVINYISSCLQHIMIKYPRSSCTLERAINRVIWGAGVQYAGMNISWQKPTEGDIGSNQTFLHDKNIKSNHRDMPPTCLYEVSHVCHVL